MAGWDEGWYLDDGGFVGNKYFESPKFGDQLRFFITNNPHRDNQRELARNSGITMQSLARFMSGEEQGRGLETPTLESLWSNLNLGMTTGTGASPDHDTGRFSEQLRAVIRASGIRQAEFAKATDISPSVLSLFLSGRRQGLSFASIERVWVYLELRIYERPVSHGDPACWIELPSGQRVFKDDGKPF